MGEVGEGGGEGEVEKPGQWPRSGKRKLPHAWLGVWDGTYPHLSLHAQRAHPFVHSQRRLLRHVLRPAALHGHCPPVIPRQSVISCGRGWDSLRFAMLVRFACLSSRRLAQGCNQRPRTRDYTPTIPGLRKQPGIKVQSMVFKASGVEKK
jgi:hypothetical protein